MAEFLSVIIFLNIYIYIYLYMFKVYGMGEFYVDYMRVIAGL